MAIDIDAVFFLRLAYLGAAALVLAVWAIAPLRSRFLDYGPRTSLPARKDKTVSGNSNKDDSNLLITILDTAAQLRVPHSWFTSFYAISVLCSLYWAPELLVKGPAFRTVSGAVPKQSHSMTFRQVMVVWMVMLAQGSRRLYECMNLSTPSKSQMWVGHWALGVFFYVATGIAIWVESVASVEAHSFTPRDLILDGPSLKTFVGLLLFMLASGLQHDCHAYLASLKRPTNEGNSSTKSEYKLPEHPAFNISLTPHYFAECLIYLSLAIAAAPQSYWLNWTMVCAMVFVVVNLGVTAHGTKAWYETKFGPDKVKGKARMIPFLY